MSSHPSPFASSEYHDYRENGGTFEAILSASEVGMNSETEESVGAEKLAKGMEFPPNLGAATPRDYFNIVNRADDCGRAVVSTYGNGGKVVYYRLDDGRYRLVFEKPVA
jgi:hypothetical protein